MLGINVLASPCLFGLLVVVAVLKSVIQAGCAVTEIMAVAIVRYSREIIVAFGVACLFCFVRTAVVA